MLSKRPEVHRMSFSGKLLERGFWLYACLISCGKEKAVYVGRTGDSSSPFAASPFSRFGRHLDIRKNAKSNSMSRQIREGWGKEPAQCHYEVVAFGPIFLEQEGGFEQHKLYRDQVAALETELAALFQEEAPELKLLGKHGKPNPDKINPLLSAQVRQVFHRAFG